MIVSSGAPSASAAAASAPSARSRRARRGSRAAAGTRRAAGAGSSEPLEVVLAEQPVAALRAARESAAPRPRGSGPSRSRCRGTRRQPPHDLADAKRSLAALWVRCRGRHAMNVIRYLPICSSSPASSTPLSIRRRLTKVPFSDPESSTTSCPSRSTQDRVVARHGDVVEEDLAVGRAPDPRARPRRLEALPGPAAALAHDEGGAFVPDDRVVLEVADLLGRERLRRLDGRCRPPASSAPQRAQ